jgi:membrane fusion protein (multidrug efflux system)
MKPLLLFFVLATAPTLAIAAESPSPPVVTFARPVRGEINRRVTLPGSVQAYQQATLYAKVAGYLKSIRVDKGDSVKAGALLAEIEVPELVADLTRLRVEADVSKTEYGRLRDAREKAADLVVPQVVDEARGKWEVAQANLERTETLLAYARIIAPFSGVVTRRLVDPGAFIPAATSGSVAQNAAVLTLMDFSRVRVQVPVPEREASLVRTGAVATVSVEGLPGRRFDGNVTRVSFALDEATRTMLAEIELSNPRSELRPGMYASVEIVAETRRDVLLVPASALSVDKAGSAVFTLAASTAKRQVVKVGFNDGTRAEILEGLREDQPVILIGKQALSDGQVVAATEAK